MITKLQNLIKRAIQTLVPDDSGIRQIVQVKFLGQTKKVKAVSPYGVFGAPPLNSDWIILSARGNADDLYGIGNDYKNRIKDLKAGELVLMNTITQDFIHFKEDGTVKHKASTAVEIEAPIVNIISPTVNFTENVNIAGTLTLDGVVVNEHDHGNVTNGGGVTDPMQ